MSYLSLLAASAMQGMANVSRQVRGIETEPHIAADGLEGSWAGPLTEMDDYHLPLGISSLDHWMDLNA